MPRNASFFASFPRARLLTALGSSLPLPSRVEFIVLCVAWIAVLSLLFTFVTWGPLMSKLLTGAPDSTQDDAPPSCWCCQMLPLRGSRGGAFVVFYLIKAVEV